MGGRQLSGRHKRKRAKPKRDTLPYIEPIGMLISRQPLPENPSNNSKGISTSLFFAVAALVCNLIIALLQWNRVTVPWLVSSFAYLFLTISIVVAFWKWEVAARWSVLSRCIGAILICAVLGSVSLWGIKTQYKKEHPVAGQQATSNNSPGPTPRSPLPSTSPELSEIQKALEEIKNNTKREGQPIVSTAQMESLKELDEFIVRPDEMSLRKEFGFPEMMDTNIRGIINNLNRYRRTGHLTHYLLPTGETLIDSRFAQGHIRRQGAAFIFDFDDTTIFFVILPRDNITAVKHLKEIQNSPELPRSILNALKEFDSVVSQNSTHLIEVLNAAMQENKEYYFEYDNPNSSLFHKIDALYLDTFIPLRPKADGVRDVIRKFLRVD